MKLKKSALAACIAFILYTIFFMYYKSLHAPTSQFDQHDTLFEVLAHPEEQFDGALIVDVPQGEVHAQPELVQEVTAQLYDIISESKVLEPVVVNSAEHGFQPFQQRIFQTPQEREQFFVQQGREYLNKTTINYTPLLDMDVYASEKFLSDPEGNEELTALYADAIEQQMLVPMSIRWISPQVGHGVFAEADIPQGGFIGIYGGVVEDRDLVKNKDYAWAYPMDTLQGGKISLDAYYKGNELCLINDGKDPNCEVKYIIGHDGFWHVCYIASRDIKKGEQLLISYGPAYWQTRKYGYQELSDIK